MESLALVYRPRTFDDIVGQREVQVFLRRMVETGRVPHALLFEGSRGTGKTTTARILAAALNCETTTGPCGQCPSCKSVFDATSMDVTEIDAASNGLVANIRDLREQVMYSTGGRYRVVILDEAQSVSTAGFNALLKTIEEPPPNTVFILITTEPHKILDTVTSRCMPFRFRRMSVADITTRLTQICHAENFTIDTDLLHLLAERGDGAMRNAIMLLDQVTRVGITTAEQYLRLLGHVDVAPALITALSNGDIAHTFALLEAQMAHVADYHTITNNLTSVLTDVLVLRCQGDISKTGDALTQRQNLALTLDTPVVVAALKVLWELKTRLRLDDPRSTLELAVVMLSEVLCAARPTPPPPPAAKLNVAQMASYLS